MGRYLVILCLAILAVAFAMACKQPGLPCADDDDCCGPLVCNPWAGRCTLKPGGPWVPEPGNPDEPPAEGQQ